MTFSAAMTDFSAQFDAVDPADFIRPDGSIDVTPLNLGDEEAVAAVREYQRSLRECRPANPAVEEA